MWEEMAEGKIMNLFQFETQVGGVCIKRTRPQNVKELGAANAVMRLMPQEGQENPLDRYVRFRHNIQEWYKEMEEWGLTKEEMSVLEKYVLSKYGNAPEQEDMMLLVMDPAISGFSLKDSNKLRKGVAKKSSKIIAEMKDKFFQSATE
jgi:DNA polymerase-3 subunit alpha